VTCDEFLLPRKLLDGFSESWQAGIRFAGTWNLGSAWENLFRGEIVPIAALRKQLLRQRVVQGIGLRDFKNVVDGPENRSV
jgi:hypothetical protein